MEWRNHRPWCSIEWLGQHSAPAIIKILAWSLSAGPGRSWRRDKCLQMIDTKPQTRDYSNLGHLISNSRWKITHITEILWESDQTRRGCSRYSCLHPVFSNFTNYQLDHAMTAEIQQRSSNLWRKTWLHIVNWDLVVTQWTHSPGCHGREKLVILIADHEWQQRGGGGVMTSSPQNVTNSRH